MLHGEEIMSDKKSLTQNAFSIVLILVFLIFLFGAAGCDQAPTDIHTGTPVKVLVVMLEMTKQPNCSTPAACAPYFDANGIAAVKTPRHTASEYLAMLDQQVNTYYHNATYGQMYFDFELLPGSTRADGWQDSPYTMSQINANGIDFKQIAMTVAYSAIGENLKNYERVIIISNFQSRGGQTCCVSNPTPYYAIPGKWKTGLGVTPMIVAMINEGSSDNELITVTAHELGHTIGAPDQYYGGGVGMGMWDLMDDDWNYFHFGAWTKLDRGWIDWNANTTRMPCDSGSCEITTILNPVETQGNNALLIPTSNSAAFTGILVECRKPINGDEGIPEDGVLVSFSNPYNDKTLAKTISEIRSNKANVYSLLQPGEIYYSPEYDIRVINQSKPGDTTCTVKAERAVPPKLDVYITQGSITQGAAFDKYESPDIWNDIFTNGWDKYPDYVITSEVDTTYKKKVIVPAGTGDPYVYGDPAVMGDYNVIKFIVHNGGTLTAKNISVNLYLRQPLSVTVQPDGCGAPAESSNFPLVTIPQWIGHFTIPSLAPGQSFYVDRSIDFALILDSKAPFEVEVEIEQLDGEDDITNNIAYETYMHPYGAINAVDAMSATLSDKCASLVPFIAEEIPDENGKTCDKWDLVIEPSSGFLKPGEKVNFNITGKPRDAVKAGETCNARIGVFMPVTDVFTPVESFGFTARAVDPSSLTCSTVESATLGTPVNVTGQLDPAKADTIALVYTNPAGKTEMKNLETQNNGQYGDMVTPALTGTWGVRALWVGDEKHAPTQSEMCRFTVKEKVEIVKKPPVFTPGKAVQCRRGPSVFWDSLGFVQAWAAYPVVGVNPGQTWWNIQYTDKLRCWVKADSGAATGDLSGVEVLVVNDITPTLIPTVTPTLVPQVNCGSYTEDKCKMVSACYWEPETTTHPAECKPTP
jgi:hypothetical protein